MVSTTYRPVGLNTVISQCTQIFLLTPKAIAILIAHGFAIHAEEGYG